MTDLSSAAALLDTPISQTGSLSAGERQLVALARAVLRRSSVIIMDEATSQIDVKLDDQVCPVVGTVTTVLPPDHPATAGKPDDAECPVTKARVGHHKGRVVGHPDVSHAKAGAVCHGVGAKA